MNLSNQTGIWGEHVLLRAICREDLEQLRSFVNDPEIMQFSNTYQPITDHEQEAWFQRISQSSTDQIWFAILDTRQSNQHLIGTCCLVGFDWVSRPAEMRIRIGNRDVWGQGLGTEATRLLLSYGFESLNLERQWLRVYAANERAIHMYQKVGFQIEGKLRRAMYIGGQAQDVILMGLLRKEWAEHGDRSIS